MTRHTAVWVALGICSVLFGSSAGYAKVKISFTPKDASQRVAKPESCEIRIFQDSKPDQPYLELGILNYHDERHRTKAGALKLEVAMPKIKAMACKIGADALIDIRVTEVRRLEFAMFNVRATPVLFEQK